MPFSEEIKLETIDKGFRFGEYHIDYSERIGETKLYAWKDGVDNLLYLFRLRLRGTLAQRLVNALLGKRRKSCKNCPSK